MKYSVYENIRKIRELKNLTREYVAAELKMSTSGYGKIERGERKANREQVAKLAEVLDVEVDELLVIWLSDKIMEILEEEPLAYKALKKSEKRIQKK